MICDKGYFEVKKNLFQIVLFKISDKQNNFLFNKMRKNDN